MGERHRDVLGPRTATAVGGSFALSGKGPRALAVLTLVFSLLLPLRVRAEGAAILLPSTTPAPACEGCPTAPRPDPESEARLASLCRELDAVLLGAMQDLGFTVDVSAERPETEAPPKESDLVKLAGTAWAFWPRLALSGSRINVRITAVAPGSSVLLLRGEDIRPDELEVRAVLMMRDLVAARSKEVTAPSPVEAKKAEGRPVRASRSPGRAVLALNAAVLGGYVGFSLQRAGGGTDARLTYPLIALGAGLGLGASMIVAGEWDVGVGDAWYLAAGTWWPIVGTLLLSDGIGVAENTRYLYSAGAAAGGLALAATAMNFGEMNEGGALIAHSGGAFGTVLGAITDLAVQGRTDVSPTRGAGIGAIGGVVVAGAVARVAPPQPAGTVLLVDLAAGLGGLTGAALGSPLVFGDEVSATDNRLWLSGIALGTLVGAGIGLLVLAPASDEGSVAPRAAAQASPFAGVIGASTAADGSVVPITGAGVRGSF